MCLEETSEAGMRRWTAILFRQVPDYVLAGLDFVQDMPEAENTGRRDMDPHDMDPSGQNRRITALFPVSRPHPDPLHRSGRLSGAGR